MITVVCDNLQYCTSHDLSYSRSFAGGILYCVTRHNLGSLSFLDSHGSTSSRLFRLGKNTATSAAWSSSLSTASLAHTKGGGFFFLKRRSLPISFCCYLSTVSIRYVTTNIEPPAGTSELHVHDWPRQSHCNIYKLLLGLQVLYKVRHCNAKKPMLCCCKYSRAAHLHH
jgi:hypothetical protein